MHSRSSQMQVLILDDDRFFTQLAGGLAAEKGHVVEEFNSTVNFDLSKLVNFDIIFLDIMMPHLDGVKILHAVREYAPALKVVLMTALGEKLVDSVEGIAKAIGVNVLGRLHKPFKTVELLAFLDTGEDQALQAEHDSNLKTAALTSIIDTMAREDISLKFQPQVIFATGRWVGCEILAQEVILDNVVHSINSKTLSPDTARLAARYQLSVLGLAMANTKQLELQTGMKLSLSVKAMTTALLSPDFPGDLLAIMQQHDFSPNNLVIQLDEIAYLDKSTALLEAARVLRSKRIRISFSVTNNALLIPTNPELPAFDEIRIDRSLIANLDKQHIRNQVAVLLKRANQLCRSTVANGVADIMAYKWLCANGCDIGQGPLIYSGADVSGLFEWHRTRAGEIRRRIPG